MIWRRSFVDTWLIARFEVLRAIRSWSALALVLLYLIANVGGAYLFILMLGQMESTIASQLQVPTTKWPGTMTEQIRTSEAFIKVLDNLIGDHATAESLLQQPFLAVFQLWQGFVLIPFLAATSAAESIAADVRTRAIRFEVMRTGRLEVVAGRMLGQIGLCLFATCVALLGVWTLGMTTMAQQDPFELGFALLSLGLRAVWFSVPFVGLGIAASQTTASPAWARVLALGGTAATWVVYWIALAVDKAPWALVSDLVLPVLPQTYLGGLWQTGGGWIGSSLAVFGLGAVIACVGYVRFARRDL